MTTRTAVGDDKATGPLDGIRVIEMGQLLAGPFCGQLLGDLGAEVIKLEAPGVGDPMREWGHVKPEGRSLWWPIVARNKMSVTCNLRTDAGQALARRMVRDADILVENFRPGTLERWSMSPEELWEINPRLIIVRVTGFGQSGPYSDQAGYGSIGEAMGGIRYVTGDPSIPPSRTGVSLGDSLAGTFACIGALGALVARDRIGRGQIVDSAIYEAVLALMESVLPEWSLGNYQRERTGATLPGVAPSNVYPTADGTSVLIAANMNTVFRRLAQVMGRPGLADDERFSTHTARGDNAEVLDNAIAEWSSTLDSDDVLRSLNENGVPAGRVYRAADMFRDPHFAARDSIVRVKDPVLGDVPMQNVFPQLSETPGNVRWTGPDLGEHNDIVYGSLGLSPEDIDELRDTGII